MDVKAWIGAGATLITLSVSALALAKSSGSSEARVDARLGALETEQGIIRPIVAGVPAQMATVNANQKNTDSHIQRLDATVDELGRDIKDLLKSQRGGGK